jgi:hypothetical protein
MYHHDHQYICWISDSHTVPMKNMIIWVIMPCSSPTGFLPGIMFNPEDGGSVFCETSLDFYQSIKNYNPDDCTLQWWTGTEITSSVLKNHLTLRHQLHTGILNRVASDSDCLIRTSQLRVYCCYYYYYYHHYYSICRQDYAFKFRMNHPYPTPLSPLINGVRTDLSLIKRIICRRIWPHQILTEHKFEGRGGGKSLLTILDANWTVLRCL